MYQANTHSHHPTHPSNQKFGVLFAFVFVLVSAYAFWKGYAAWAATLIVLAAVFVAITVIAPTWLAPLNKLWYQLGMLLGHIVSPIVLGLIFFVLITPTAVISRFFGRDVLLIKKRAVSSYWVERTPLGPQPESFKNQF